MRTVFLRALEAEDKAAAVLMTSRHRGVTRVPNRFEVDPLTFSAIPRSPFAYWVSDSLRATFRHLPALESSRWTAKVGIQTSDDQRFVRLWWAVSPRRISAHWIPFAKGGAFSQYYADIYLVVGWGQFGAELKAWAGSLYNESHWSRILKNTQLFLRPGVTWPLRTQRGLSLRAMPEGCAFGHKGPAAFALDNKHVALLALLAVGNSSTFRALVELQMAFGSYEVGVIQRTPVPDLLPRDETALSVLGRRAWSLKRSLETRTETSPVFSLPALLQLEGETVVARAATWSAYVRATEAQLAAIQAEIDERCFALYGIDEEDRRAITEGFSANAGGSDIRQRIQTRVLRTTRAREWR